jgi:uncharacterized membrane protein
MSEDTLGLLLIVAIGVVTYLTRASGYFLLSRFQRLDPRVEAGLDAVPVAVMTAIAAPIALTSGPAETGAALVTIVAALRLPMHFTLLAGVGAVVGLRALGL